MVNQTKTLVILLVFTTLFKGIVWASLVPMWHVPDEQAHFAQVQYYAELKSGIEPGNDLSLEVSESERLLGTLRDDRGVNKFTYHPEYRIEYSETYIGVHEKEIETLPNEARTTFVKKEAARYPPLFYVLSSIGYLIGYQGSLFVRVFLARIISVLLAAATVWATFLLAKSIFPKNFLLAFSSTALLSFQPMFTFITSGINNDNLMNLLSTALLWIMVDSMRKRLSALHTLGMGAFLGLGIITKQLIYPFIPLPLLVIAYHSFVKKTNSFMRHLILLIFVGLICGGLVFTKSWLQSGRLPGWPSVTQGSPGYSLTFAAYLSEKLPKLYRETLPWYWGVFNWLGVVLPINLLRAIKVGLAVSGIGLVKYTASKFRKRKLETQDWQLLLLGFSSIWYAFWLLFWDYNLIRSIGFSHGIQGRNFFPTISAHMILVAFGLWQTSKKYRKFVVKTATLAIVLLNFMALKTMLDSYYILTPLTTLVTQASQYKPWFFKGGGLILWFVIYATFLSNFLSEFIRLNWRK